MKWNFGDLCLFLGIFLIGSGIFGPTGWVEKHRLLALLEQTKEHSRQLAFYHRYLSEKQKFLLQTTDRSEAAISLWYFPPEASVLFPQNTFASHTLDTFYALRGRPSSLNHQPTYTHMFLLFGSVFFSPGMEVVLGYHNDGVFGSPTIAKGAPLSIEFAGVAVLMLSEQEIDRCIEHYVRGELHTVFKQEILDLRREERWEQLNERFAEHLSFGTAGIRGIIGGGYSRFNAYNMLRVTQGLIEYLKKNRVSHPQVVINYDARHYSSLLARDAASLLCGAGVKVFLFQEPRPTPFCPFVVRLLKASLGLMITASHNPKDYNGCKIYVEHGYPISGKEERRLIEEVQAVQEFGPLLREQEAVAQGKLQYLTAALDTDYKSLVIHPHLLRRSLIQTQGKSFSLTYSALHGVGGALLPSSLEELGFKVHYVEEQQSPQGDFLTAPEPNPEFIAPWKLAFAKAKEQKSQLILVNDPDADRLGVAVWDSHQNHFHLLSGNEVGGLLLDYLVNTRKEYQTFPLTPYFVNSIVTSLWHQQLAQYHELEQREVPTGFKWIMNEVKDLDRDKDLILTMEESIGYGVSPFIRDKDGLCSAALVAEMALYYHQHQQNLLQRLEHLYYAVGYAGDKVLNYSFRDSQHEKRVKQLVADVREKIPREWSGIPVLQVYDFQTATVHHLASSPVKWDLGFSKTDVLQLFLADGTRLTIRPSGTEPKIKIYLSLKAQEPYSLAVKDAVIGKLRQHAQACEAWLSS